MCARMDKLRGGGAQSFLDALVQQGIAQLAQSSTPVTGSRLTMRAI
jgi:hypothetical protein